MRTRSWIILGLLLLFFVTALIAYPRMPDPMISHWNAQGQPDGTVSRFWGVFFVPLLALPLTALLLAIPTIDPLKANIQQFRRSYDGFVILFLAYLFYIYLLTLLWNVGVQINLLQALSPAFAALFYAIGALIEKARQNWFIGIRTPWTLSNEIVWQRTHERGGKLFKAAGLLAMLGILWPQAALYLVLAPALLIALYTTAYSYVEYRRVVGG